VKQYSKYKKTCESWLNYIPDSWSIVSLKLIVDVRDGTHDTPSYVEPNDDTFPLVTSKDVTSGTLDLTNSKHISQDDYKAIIKRSEVSEGDIIMPMIGTVGFPIIIHGNSSFAIKNLALFKTCNTRNLSSRYLCYFIGSKECMMQFDLESRGGVQNFVSLGTLRNLKVPYFPLPEQKRLRIFWIGRRGRLTS
jgi:type I restriction enzyme S subunit